jgi:uncharacterized membrane protein YoaK (UPF0700 family)
MTFEEVLEQAMAMLQRRGRTTYRTLKLQFQLDDERLEALKEALLETEHVAVHEAEHVLVWAPLPDTPPELSRSIALRNALLLLLAWAAGGVDAASYLRLGHVFTANMTGNTVLLGLALSQVESHAIIRSSCALAGFLTGGALGAWVAHRGDHDGVWPLSVTFVLLLEWGVLVVFAVGWQYVGDTTADLPERMVLITLSALAMGLQSAAARRLDISGIATTFITGTLTTLMGHLVGSRPRGVPAHQALSASGTHTRVPMTSGPGLLATTWVVYIGGATAAATLPCLGPLFAFVFPIALLTVVLFTALVCFRRLSQ